jgi:tRNA pseudouridine55 synthase
LSFPSHGLVILNKPPGITSFQALGEVKSRLNTTKVGHTGTLDCFSEGVLLLLTGPYTRLAPYFVPLDKEYEALIRLGEETETLDPEGEVVKRTPLPSLNALITASKRFSGEIWQVPPHFSAVHWQGKRAYKMARQGIKPVLSPRKVRILFFDFIKYDPPDMYVRVGCSKGTYVRALARDLAHSAGSCAHVRELKRTKQGPFCLSSAIGPLEFDPARHVRSPGEFLKDLPGIRIGRIKPPFAARIRTGAPIDEEAIVAPPEWQGDVALLNERDELIAAIRRRNGEYQYVAVFAQSGDRRA